MINHYLTFNFQLKQFIYFTLAFFCFTIIGTLSHEYGHIAVAKFYGFPTTLHYGSMNYDDISIEKKEIGELVFKNEQAIIKREDYPDKTKLINLGKITNERDLFITFGGPIQTMLFGTIGFIYLLNRRKIIDARGIKFKDWFFVFVSLFWLRELFNLLFGIFGKLFFGSKNYFNGDEKNIALHLNLPRGLFAVSFGIIGLVISVILIFKIIPKKYRFTFICSGLIGGICGFLFWLKWVGPILLP